MISIELKIKDFIDWHPRVEMASQSNRGKLTRLNAVVDFHNDSITYEVIIKEDHSDIILNFEYLSKAIEAYNENKED